MQTIHVRTKTSSYPIYIGDGLLEQAENLLPHITGTHVLLVTNHTVAQLYQQKLVSLLKDAKKIYNSVILPAGEQFKNINSLALIFDALLSNHYDRDCTIIALGGGVIGDLAGFAAACYQRGVHFIQIPTTLLAQVDAAVGGKVAVNHYAGKNMIGAFYQPHCVISDIATLMTLPQREYRAGLAEVIKYALIQDQLFWQWLLHHVQDLLEYDKIALQYVVEKSCFIKSHIVAEDEKEQGLRAILNFGHTVGHALESGLGYGVYLHGEAVGIGMLVATRLSVLLGMISGDVVRELTQLLIDCGLPTQPPQHFTKAHCWQHMRLDKKIVNQELRFIVLRTVGAAQIVYKPSKELLDKALEQTGFRD